MRKVYGTLIIRRPNDLIAADKLDASFVGRCLGQHQAMKNGKCTDAHRTPDKPSHSDLQVFRIANETECGAWVVCYPQLRKGRVAGYSDSFLDDVKEIH